MDNAVPFIAIVPARLASTRLPGKPLADIGGRPMVVLVAERAHASGASRVIVAADDDSIVDAVRAHGHEAMLTRTDHASGTDRLAEVVASLGLDDDAIVVNVQGDEPLIDASLVARCAVTLAAHPECAMATACHPISTREDFDNPNIVKGVVDAQGRALYFSRAAIPLTRDAGAGPARYGLRHVGLYAYRAGFLRTFTSLAAAPLETAEALEQLRALWHGYRIAVFETGDAPAGGVDTPEDLARVRAVVAARDRAN